MSNKQKQKPVLDFKALNERAIHLKIGHDHVLKDLFVMCTGDVEKRAELTRLANSAKREYDKILLLMKDLI
jgi:hypothetical protein